LTNLRQKGLTVDCFVGQYFAVTPAYSSTD